MISPALLRAAAAFQKSEAWSSFWSEDDALVMATAVVRALRDYDEATELAGLLAQDVPGDPVIRKIWPAMIDEILA